MGSAHSCGCSLIRCSSRPAFGGQLGLFIEYHRRQMLLCHIHVVVAVALSLACAACSTKTPTTERLGNSTGLGTSKATAIEVCGPAGERAYLSRLLCSDGSALQFKRIGSFGSRNKFPENLSAGQQTVLVERIMRGSPLQPGEQDYHVIDGYELVCGTTKHVVYLDMYHCHQAEPNQAPLGFTIRPSALTPR